MLAAQTTRPIDWTGVPMMRFQFATAGQILFGSAAARRVAKAAAGMGRRVFLATGTDRQQASSLEEDLAQLGLACVTFTTPSEPTIPMAQEAIEQARNAKADLVIALGGGSVIDLAKTVAAMLTNEGDLIRYLEVVGDGRPVQCRCTPWIAIPTTAGTGAEVTCNAVLLVPEHRRKVSLRSPLMLASMAVVDPDLTHTMSPHVTASTGLDALTQLIEPFVGLGANPMTDGLCREGIRRVARSLARAYACGDDAEARQDMALASLFGGLALANAGLGAVHGLAGPLGGHLIAPHGALCGRLLPWIMEANVRALAQRAPTSPAMARFDELGSLLTGSPGARAADAIQWVHGLCRGVAIPGLAHWGLACADIPALADRARASSSTKGNPVALTTEELAEVLEKAM
jgi:alcohol dehydrogenase class IV